MKCNVITRCFSNERNKSVIWSQLIHFRSATAAVSSASFDDATLAAAKPFEEMPSAKIVPLLGTMWEMLPIIGRYYKKDIVTVFIDKKRRFGEIYRDKVGSLNFVISTKPDDMVAVYEAEGIHPNRGDILTIKAYRESRKQWYSSTGLMILQGKEWQDLRSKTQKHLMKPKAVQAYMSSMQDISRELVDKIYKVRDSNKEVPNFLDELYNWSLESVAFVALDTRLGCLKTDSTSNSDGKQMIHAVHEMLETLVKIDPIMGKIPFWKLFPTPNWKRFCNASDTFSEIAFKNINHSLEELKKPKNKDKDLTLLQAMLQTKDLDLSGVMVTAADMLSAGIDTTSNTVGFLLYHLARNPEKQDLLFKEISRLLPQKENKFTPEIFNELKYLKACLKESLRLNPAAGGFGRLTDRDTIISGYRVPAGTFCVVFLQLICLDEKYFSNPNQFIPERWIEKDEKFHPFAYAPFGIGKRSCIGRRLAELEMISLITELIRHFKIEYHHEDIGIHFRLVNTPDKPLRFNFIER